MFRPFTFSELKNYSFSKFTSDLFAGCTVGVIALPLAMAFAIASGFPPERGIYTAIVAGFLISLFGGSKVQIGGPTGAFIVIVSGIYAQFGSGGLLTVTLMAGGLLVLLGLFQMGALIKFIPFPVVTGFTSGIAVVIFLTQINDLLGLNIDKVPSDFFEKFACYARHIGAVDVQTVSISLLTIGLIILLKRFFPRLPAMLLGMIGATLFCMITGFDVETIGSRFGELPRTLPMPEMPELPAWHDLPNLMMPAFTIALLAGIESLLSATVADGMTGGRHRPNTELIAQGIGNIASSLFNGIPATGAIARTATNIKSGAQTPVAGMIHALALAMILLVFAPQAKLIPLAALGGIMVLVCYNMCEYRTFLRMFRGPKSDWLVMLVTFLLTVMFDLVIAVEAGVVLAALLFIRRMSAVVNIRELTGELGADPVSESDDPDAISKRDIPSGISVFEVQGPFFFGAVDAFKDKVLSDFSKIPEVIILRMRHVPVIDATALHLLSDFVEQCRQKGILLIFSGIQRRSQPIKAMREYGIVRAVGPRNITPHIDAALSRARKITQKPQL